MEGELHFREPTPETEGPDPPEAAGLRLTLEEYHREMQMLAKKVERCFALALDLGQPDSAPNFGLDAGIRCC